MSDKPKIYSYCKAGCPWETVHRSEFEQAATFAKQEKNADGYFELQIGKEYKIISPFYDRGEFKAQILIPYAEISGGFYPLGLKVADEYATSCTVRVLDIQPKSVVYEIAGVRYRASSTNPLKQQVFVRDATECYIYNTDANIEVKPISVVNAYLTPKKHLIIVLSDGKEIDAGSLLNEPITFTIDGVSYTAIDGQTWGEFVAEHSDKFEIFAWSDEVALIPNNGEIVSYPNSTTVKPSETIQANTAYIYTYPHGA